MQGRVQFISRYPLKSAQGEQLESVLVDQRGLAGDRRAAVLDVMSGKIASAKRPQLWRDLLNFSAAYDQEFDQVYVFLDGCEYLAAPSPQLDRALSKLLKRQVTIVLHRDPGFTIDRSKPEEVLARGVHAEVAGDLSGLAAATPNGGFVDFAPVHLLLSSSVHAVAGMTGPQWRRFRPNFVIEADAAPFAENTWIGRRVMVGDVLMEVLCPAPRCAVPILKQAPAIGADPNILKNVRKSNLLVMQGLGEVPCLGLYARILEGGRIEKDAQVRVMPPS